MRHVQPLSLERPAKSDHHSRSRCEPRERRKKGESEEYRDPETYVREMYPQERFAPMTSRSEEIVSIDSAHRDRSKYPDPGECTIKCVPSNGQKRIMQVSLATLELPKSQWTVEEDEFYIYFDEGVELPDDEASRTIVFRVGSGEEVYASVFRANNPITSVQGPFGTGPYTYRITTESPHLMDLLSYYTGATVELIGLAGLTNAGDRAVTSPNVTVVDDYNFDVALPSNTLVAGSSSDPPMGYVHVPPFRNPTVLARVLEGAVATQIDTIAFPELAGFSATFDRTTGKFAICAALERGENLSIRITESASLAWHLGFVCDQRIVGNDPASCLPRFMRRGNACATSGIIPSWIMKIRVPPGLYGPQGLRDQIDFEANRLNFEACCDALPNNMARFVFTDACGECQAVNIPYGRWTPDQLAYYLQTSMNDIAGEEAYAVDYAPFCGNDGGRFVFRSVDGRKFGLEFAAACSSPSLPTPASSPDVPERLGFNQCNYRGSDYYASDQPVAVPGYASQGFAGNCCVDRWARYNWCISHNGSTKSYGLSLNAPAGIAYVVQSIDGNSVRLAPSDPNRIASYQTGQSLNFSPQGDPSTVYTGIVEYALNPTDPSIDYAPGSVTVDMGSLAASLAVNDVLCVSQAEREPTFNLYLIDKRHYPCSFDSKLLGLDPTSYLFGYVDPSLRTSDPPEAVLDAYAGVPPYAVPRLAINNKDQNQNGCGFKFVANVVPPYRSTHAYDFGGPRYVLVELVSPSGYRACSSTGPDGLQKPVFTKVLLYPDVRVERIYPMYVTFGEPTNVVDYQFRFYNPDLTPYRFHGQDWSATLVLSVP